MTKRVLSYSVVGLLAVALLGGIAYILLNRTETRAGPGSFNGQGRGVAAESDAGFQGGRTAWSDVAARGQGSSGQGRSERVADIAWEAVMGRVVAVDGEITIRTSEGDILVGTGPAAHREGPVPEVGDAVSVTGFYENGEFKAGTVENLTTGATLVLRDEAGRPVWSGSGRFSR